MERHPRAAQRFSATLALVFVGWTNPAAAEVDDPYLARANVALQKIFASDQDSRDFLQEAWMSLATDVDLDSKLNTKVATITSRSKEFGSTNWTEPDSFQPTVSGGNR